MLRRPHTHAHALVDVDHRAAHLRLSRAAHLGHLRLSRVKQWGQLGVSLTEKSSKHFILNIPIGACIGEKIMHYVTEPMSNYIETKKKTMYKPRRAQAHNSRAT